MAYKKPYSISIAKHRDAIREQPAMDKAKVKQKMAFHETTGKYLK